MSNKIGFAKMDKESVKKLAAMGGKAGTGHKFAHGKVDPSVAGKLGGRPSKEVLFVPDDRAFSEGFGEPTFRERLTRRFRNG